MFIKVILYRVRQIRLFFNTFFNTFDTNTQEMTCIDVVHCLDIQERFIGEKNDEVMCDNVYTVPFFHFFRNNSHFIFSIVSNHITVPPNNFFFGKYLKKNY